MAVTQYVRALCIAALLLFSPTSGEPLKRQATQLDKTARYDYVLLGGGTAGLVVAARLSEDPDVTVAVVEAGDFQKNNPRVTNNTQVGYATKTSVDWQYKSVPQVFGGNKSIIWSAGKGVGGSSLINGMTYMRPASSQIDLWRSIGLDLDWSILFDASRRTEHFDPPSADLVRLGASFEASAHGFNGPLLTCVSQHMPTSQIHETFNETFKALGIPPRHEFCGGQLRGFGVQATAQDDTLDIREDAARAYYYPIMDRPNLVVLVNTTATRILWAPQDRSGADAVASGAEAVAKNGETVQIFANREVIVSAGAIRSPSILEQSGVGNPSVLAKQSIDVKISLPAVGENFQDQSVSIVTAQTAQVFTGFPVFVANIGLQDLLGSNASGFYNATKAKLASYAATIASQNGGASDASVQEYLLRTQLDLLMRSNTPVSELAPIALLDYIEIAFWPLQPFSRGSVHINSRNKTAPPALDAKYFQLDIDNHLMAATARFARKLLTTPPLSTIVNVSTITPSFTTVPEDASDAVWMDWINEKPNYGPNCHHLGTCTMLPKCFGGVVDNDYRVYGSANVRVVDLSVVPLQIAGHSTAPLYGIAELAAAKIKAHSRRHF